MQQKFKVGDKVKVLTKAYSSAYGTEGVITKVGGYSTRTYTVDRNTADYPPDQYGTFDTDSWRYCFYESELELVTDQEVSNTEHKCNFEVGNEVLLGDCLAEVASVKQYDTVTLIGVKQGNYYFIVSPEELQHYKKEESEKVAKNTQKLYQDLKESFEQLFADEPNYTIGQEVYVSNDFNRYLRKGVLLDAIPRNGLMYVNIGGFDCYVEEERVYTKEMKGD